MATAQVNRSLDRSNKTKEDLLRAAKRVDLIWNKLAQREFEEKQIFLEVVKFYGTIIKESFDSDESIMKLIRAILIVMDIKGNSYWDVNRLGSFLTLFCKLIIYRKDDIIIQEVSTVMRDLLDRIPDDIVRVLTSKNISNVKILFWKLGHVSSYKTQFKLIINLHQILSKSEDNGTTIIGRLLDLSKSGPKKLLQCFLRIVSKDLYESSRDFLNYYNQFYKQVPFIYTYQGYVFQMNGTELQELQMIFIDFNGRSLTISFYLPSKCLGIKEQSGGESLLYIELQDCRILADYEENNSIEVNLLPNHCQILDDNEISVSDIPEIRQLMIVLKDKPDRMKIFMNNVYEAYKSKKPIALDDENESVLSFGTAVSSHIINGLDCRVGPLDESVTSALVDCKQLPQSEAVNTQMSSKTSKNASIDKKVKEHVSTFLKPPVVKNIAHARKKPATGENSMLGMRRSTDDSAKPPIVQKVKPLQDKNFQTVAPVPINKQRPKRIATRRMTAPMQSDYDLIEDFDEPMPTFRSFMSQKREKRHTFQIREQMLDDDRISKDFTPKAAVRKRNPPKSSAAAKRKSSTRTSKKQPAKMPTNFIEPVNIDTSTEGSLTSQQLVIAAEVHIDPEVPGMTRVFKKSEETTSQRNDGNGTINSIKVIRNVTVKRRMSFQKNANILTSKRRLPDEWNEKGQGSDKRTKGQSNDNSAIETFDDKHTKVPAQQKTRNVQEMSHVPFNGNVEFISNRLRSKEQEAAPNESSHTERDENVVYNLNTLKNNEMLKKFIADQRQRDKSEETNMEKAFNMLQNNENTREVRFEEIIVQHHTSQVNQKVKTPENNSENNVDELMRQFSSKLSAKIESLTAEIENLMKPVDMHYELKSKIKETAVKCKNSNEILNAHASQYVDLLKRIHITREKLVFLRDDHNDNMNTLYELHAKAENDMSKESAARQNHLDKLIAKMEATKENTKKEIWQEYLDSISNKVQEVVKKNYDI